MASQAKYHIQFPSEGVVSVAFSGNWALGEEHPKAESLLSEIEPKSAAIKKVFFSDSGIAQWDSSLVTVVYSLARFFADKKSELVYTELPDGLQGLLRLALAVKPQAQQAEKPKEPFLARTGENAISVFESIKEVLSFLGEITISLFRFVTGRAKIKKSDFLEIVYQSGPCGLGIVLLISFLVGVILAYIGAVQLEQFGAEIFVANLVGIAMAREMGGVMASIIVAGRTGAAFAAQLGTMQVNEEIDALKTLGFSPTDYLVLPRMLSLILMNPLLCVFAILAGILGGMIVSVMALGISFPLYWDQTVGAVKIADVVVGVTKSIVFGILVAICGCYFGMKCGRSASAVGEATTSAVVSSIVCVVVADAIFAVLTSILGL